MKTKLVEDGQGRFYGIRFDCPGCALMTERGSKMVVLPVDWTPPGMERAPETSKPWGFNGDLEKPTFTPSILTRYPVYGVGERICHSYVRDGMIEFLSDCTHALAGQTVPLPDLD